MNAALRYGWMMGLAITACGRDRPPGDGPAERSETSSPAPATDYPAARGGGGAARAALRDPVPMSVTVEAGGATAGYRGEGECHHTSDASIYEVPAAMWSAQVASESGELRYLNLTLWQPKGATELQVSLGLTLGQRAHDIATVRGAPGKGSGTARVDPAGAGGSMQVEGKAADGTAIRLRIECERWTEPVAEGG